MMATKPHICENCGDEVFGNQKWCKDKPECDAIRKATLKKSVAASNEKSKKKKAALKTAKGNNKCCDCPKDKGANYMRCNSCLTSITDRAGDCEGNAVYVGELVKFSETPLLVSTKLYR